MSKYSVGAYVSFSVRIDDHELFSGRGLIVEKGDVDDKNISDAWIILSNRKFLLVREIYMELLAP